MIHDHIKWIYRKKKKQYKYLCVGLAKCCSRRADPGWSRRVGYLPTSKREMFTVKNLFIHSSLISDHRDSVGSEKRECMYTYYSQTRINCLHKMIVFLYFQFAQVFPASRCHIHHSQFIVSPSSSLYSLSLSSTDDIKLCYSSLRSSSISTIFLGLSTHLRTRKVEERTYSSLNVGILTIAGFFSPLVARSVSDLLWALQVVLIM